MYPKMENRVHIRTLMYPKTANRVHIRTLMYPKTANRVHISENFSYGNLLTSSKRHIIKKEEQSNSSKITFTKNLK